jgi:hypothetical protein
MIGAEPRGGPGPAKSKTVAPCFNANLPPTALVKRSSLAVKFVRGTPTSHVARMRRYCDPDKIDVEIKVRGGPCSTLRAIAVRTPVLSSAVNAMVHAVFDHAPGAARIASNAVRVLRGVLGRRVRLLRLFLQ